MIGAWRDEVRGGPCNFKDSVRYCILIEAHLVRNVPLAQSACSWRLHRRPPFGGSVGAWPAREHLAALRETWQSREAKLFRTVRKELKYARASHILTLSLRI